MGNEYSLYLIYIFIVLCVFLLAFLLIMKRIKKRNNGKIKQQDIIAGNVSAFFDRYNNAVIIPYVKDKYGTGRAAAPILYVKSPCTAQTLGRTLRSAMNSCSDGSPLTNNELLTHLNCKSWDEFSVGKRNLSVYYHDKYGIILNSTTRLPDGGYQMNQKGFERIIVKDSDDDQLGRAALNVLQRCSA